MQRISLIAKVQQLIEANTFKPVFRDFKDTVFTFLRILLRLFETCMV